MYLEKTSIEEIITNLVKDYLKSNKYTQIRVIDESVYVQLSDKISSSINSDLLSLSENHPEFENKQLIREYAGYYLLDDFFEELYVHSSKELLAVHVCELHIYDICRRFINERVIYNTVTKIEVIDILDYIVTFDESYCVTYKSYEILCILKDK